MKQVLKEKKILDFYLENNKHIEYNLKSLLDLYNQIGKKYRDSSMQLGFLSVIILQLLKSSGLEKTELLQALKNIEAKI